MNSFKEPRIAVIVAAYNQEKYIGRCLRSLLHQTLPHSEYEIIVVNDGSNDMTGFAISQFCDPFESTVKVVDNKENIGLPASLNKALRHAQAELVVRVDADDYVNENFLHFLTFYFDNNQNADAVACDYFLVDDHENIQSRCIASVEPIGCAVLFRRKDLFDIGLYDESFLSNEDKELMIRFVKKFNIAYLDVPLYRYRKHETNMTNNEDRMRKFDHALQLKHKLK